MACQDRLKEIAHVEHVRVGRDEVIGTAGCLCKKSTVS